VQSTTKGRVDNVDVSLSKETRLLILTVLVVSYTTSLTLIYVSFLLYISQGGDTDCKCDDFSEPVSREEFKGFMAAHEANKARIKPDVRYDVVFLGDETTEGWNGRLLNLPTPGGRKTQKYWNETFTSDGGGDIEGLALGIAGDSVRFSIHLFAVKSFWLLQASDSHKSFLLCTSF
jgi:hypothetical protein